MFALDALHACATGVDSAGEGLDGVDGKQLVVEQDHRLDALGAQPRRKQRGSRVPALRPALGVMAFAQGTQAVVFQRSAPSPGRRDWMAYADPRTEIVAALVVPRPPRRVERPRVTPPMKWSQMDP